MKYEWEIIKINKTRLKFRKFIYKYQDNCDIRITSDLFNKQNHIPMLIHLIVLHTLYHDCYTYIN